jgi:hypothetical protein
MVKVTAGFKWPPDILPNQIKPKNKPNGTCKSWLLVWIIKKKHRVPKNSALNFYISEKVKGS